MKLSPRDDVFERVDNMNSLSRALFGITVLAGQPAAAQNLVLDTPTVVANIDVVCTGAGLDAREDPRWRAYGLKVEVAGEGGKYLGNENVDLRRDGNLLLTVTCAGPWLLFRLPPGRYEVEARIGNQTASSAAFVPLEGQGRIVLRFSESD